MIPKPIKNGDNGKVVWGFDSGFQMIASALISAGLIGTGGVGVGSTLFHQKISEEVVKELRAEWEAEKQQELLIEDIFKTQQEILSDIRELKIQLNEGE